MSGNPSVCVIIAAFNAAATIGDAVRSALAQGEVGEVVVVDDASTDATVATARAAAGGDMRLKIVRLPTNGGVSAARNCGIAQSTAELIALLDADDYYLPDRFAGLAGRSDWDLFADNIVFLADTVPEMLERQAVVDANAEAHLDLSGFVAGNLSGRSVVRGELGFLKPVMRRSFLDAHNLRYDETLRFGEDFDLYVRSLIAGGRFIISQRVGYVARVRTGSLSVTHTARDLGCLLTAASRHLEHAHIDAGARQMLCQHRDQLRERFELREFLRLRRDKGLGKAARFALWPLTRFTTIAKGVGQDKIAHLRRQTEKGPTFRYLFSQDNTSSFD
ncbi:MAG: glycosyltransferase family 2 protein [Sulfitobacter sp.]